LLLLLLGFGKKDRAYFYARSLMPILLKIMGVKIEYRHKERLEKNSPAVFICNHQHIIDVIIHGTSFPPGTISIGKKSIRYIPFFGWLFVLCECILIDRAAHGSAMESMAKAAKEMNERKKSVWIFPEGTRSGRRGLLPFKKGAFYLALEAKRPIVPLVTSSYFKSFDLRKWHAGTVIVEILDPVPTEKLSTQDAGALRDQLHEKMAKKLTELNTEVSGRVKS
jgi:1-acyl-sn-glycerol-3-phosphate acyltransferase